MVTIQRKDQNFAPRSLPRVPQPLPLIVAEEIA
jgi:hypothetical protein